ncbi:MAG TPA: hypothetical protein VHX62_19595 [Solirubrobacteraceae bacterium]|jgi:hypothetical protein|nr:hypothetical protein [Solirubrobacteraceae bacterium]
MNRSPIIDSPTRSVIDYPIRSSAAPATWPGARVAQSDFARGQRDLPSTPIAGGDFATGLRTVTAPTPRRGDFATGLRAVSAPLGTGDFATGVRVRSARLVVARPVAADQESVALAA